MNTSQASNKIATQIKRALASGIHVLYQAFIQTNSVEEDIVRREFILNVILTTSILALSILDGSLIGSWLIHKGSYRGINIFFFTGIVAFFVLLLFLSKRGFIEISSYILIFIYFLTTTYGILTWGVELPMAALGYVLTIIIASILINTRFAIITALIITITLISAGYRQVLKIGSPDLEWKQRLITIEDPVQLSLILLFITTISWLSNREIERSLKRARNSEQALKRERDLLEIKVEERTRDLKILQAQKMAQLYRFAEFGRMSSGLFHDLMKPLTNLIHHVEGISEADNMKPQLQLAVKSSRRIGELFTSIRKQFRTDTTESYFSPQKEIQEAIDILSYNARESHTTISFKGNSNFITYGNSVKFHQIAINLIANAIDACKSVDNGNISISLRKRISTFDLIIRDTGCGIPASFKESIFNPFFTTKSETGMGLGLSTTKDIIERDFDGVILVTSTKQSETMFIAIFPIRNG